MIIYCENNGNVTTTPSTLPFGSALRDITIIAPQTSASVVLKIKPPNGEYLPDIVGTPFISKENVVLFSVKLPKAVANKAGRVEYQLFFNTSDGEVIPTFIGSFNVSKGVPSDMPGSVEQLGELSIENLYEVLSRCTEIALMTANLNEFVGIDKELQTTSKNLAEAINEIKNALAAHTYSNEAHEDIRREIKEIAEQIESGGGSGSVNLELDTTLTVEGKAADAKAVGDRIGEYIDDVDALIGGEGVEGGGSTGGGGSCVEVVVLSDTRGRLSTEQITQIDESPEKFAFKIDDVNYPSRSVLLRYVNSASSSHLYVGMFSYDDGGEMKLFNYNCTVTKVYGLYEVSQTEVPLGGGSIGGGASVEIDATLTKEGHAADAKATGDRIRTIEESIEDLKYEAISISQFSANPSTAEMGMSVQSVALSWSFNKTPTALTLNSETIDNESVSRTINGPFSTNKTWTLKATDEKSYETSRSVNLTFLNGIYYGASAEPATYDSAFILSLTKELRSSHKSSFSANAGEGQYIFYCSPMRFGGVGFKGGGFDGGFTYINAIQFKNASGYSETYYIYRSDNASLGATTVTVT